MNKWQRDLQKEIETCKDIYNKINNLSNNEINFTKEELETIAGLAKVNYLQLEQTYKL